MVPQALVEHNSSEHNGRVDSMVPFTSFSVSILCVDLNT